MIFGPSGRVNGSKKPLSLTLDTSNYSKYFKKIPNHFPKYHVWSSRHLGNLNSKKTETARADKYTRSVLQFLENREYAINPPKNMKGAFGNFELN